jgi:hypothetical protein
MKEAREKAVGPGGKRIVEKAPKRVTGGGP